MKNSNLNTLTSIGVHYHRQSVFSILSHCSDTYQRAQNHKTLGLSTSQVIVGILAILMGGLFFSHSAYAGTSISVSSQGNLSFGSIKPSSAGDIVTATDNLNITTDCSAGANIYISAVNGSATGTNLVNNAGSSNNTISTVSGTTVGNSNTAVALSNNTWGFNKTSGSNSYYGLPAYSGSVSNPLYTNAINGSTLPVYYAAKVTNTLVPGKYTGQVLYTAVINSSCLTYTVIFNKNANDATGTMNNQTIAPAASTALTSNGFTRPGYTFLGWSTNQNATSATYTNGQSVTDLAQGGGSITLYAIWRANTVTVTFDRNGDCSAVIHPSATTSCKMKDGNEWIYGNNGEAKTWDTSSCPSGYNFPAQTDFENLIAAQGSGSELYTVLGLSSSRVFWSETGSNRYKSGLEVSASGSNISYWLEYNYGESATALYFLCYKTPDTIGSMSDQTFTYNIAQTLSTNAYAMDGYDFLGWSTDPVATTATYTNGQSVTASQLASNVTTGDRSVTLYAIWRQKHAVTVNSSVGSTTGSGIYSVGATVTISVLISTHFGYEVSSWTVNSGGAVLSPTTESYGGDYIVYTATFTMPDDDVSITANIVSTCFVAGTKIQTTLAGDTKSIEDITIGDKVVSYDPNNHEYYLTEVIDTIVHDKEDRATKLAKFTLNNGAILEMTLNHPILTTTGYKALNNEDYPTLTGNDIIITTTGEYGISNIDIYDTEPTVVYNFTVRGRDGDTKNGLTHSYIANSIVAHNKVF